MSRQAWFAMAAAYGTVVFCVVRLVKWFANVLGMMAAAHRLHLAAFDAFQFFDLLSDVCIGCDGIVGGRLVAWQWFDAGFRVCWIVLDQVVFCRPGFVLWVSVTSILSMLPAGRNGLILLSTSADSQA